MEYLEASDGNGNVREFYYLGDTERERAEREAIDYANGCGYVVRMRRDRLNDYVGSPVWGEPITLEEL